MLMARAFYYLCELKDYSLITRVALITTIKKLVNNVQYLLVA
jgi:hypothetical protein